MRDRYAVWENETTHTFYIEALPNTVQPGKRLLYSGKEYLNFKNKDHAELLVNMLNGLVDEAGILEQRVHYWKIEAETDHGRWLRCLEDLERLRASSFVTAVPVEEYEKLKAEVERLTALVESNLNSSKVAMGKADAVLHERDSLKAENERLRKAGDALYYNILTYKYHIPDNGNTHFMIDASILGWNQKYGQTTEYGKAKEGKQS